MSLPIDELIKSLTPAQVKASLYLLADSLGLKTTAWQKLSPLRTIFAVIAELFSGYTRLQAAVNRSGFLELAEGVWLTLLAWFVYGVLRNAATYAEGPVLVSNAAGGLYKYGPGDLVVLNTSTKKTYANVDAVTINPLEQDVEVVVRALEAGAASSAGPGDIDAFVAASPELSVTNAESILGEDEELDPALRVRCTDKLGSLSPAGPAKAYAYIVKTPSLNGGLAGLRVLTPPAVGNGTIRVIVAGPAGAVAGTTGDPNSDLGKLFLALNKLAVPAGYTLLLSSATPVPIAGDATIYVATSSGLSGPDAENAASEALTAYVPTIPIGGVDVGAGGVVLYRALEAAIKAAHVGIIEAKLDVEADVPLAATEVATLAAFTITVEFVDA